LTGRVAILALLVLVVAGCNGGTVDRHALTNDSATIDSIACEGALLAHNVAHGKTISAYASEQAEELRIQSSNLADALEKRHALAAIEQRVRAKAKDAKRLSETIALIEKHPGDRAGAKHVESRLTKLGGCA
jgi:hypothetical protein